MILVVCFKNGEEITRVDYNDYDFPGTENEFYEMVEANWRASGMVCYRIVK